MKSILISLFICLSMCGSFVTLYGQNSTAFLSVFPSQDSIIQPNSLRFGTDKLANTFIFSNDADASIYGKNGLNFFMRQRYRGTIMRTSTTAVRDDQGIHIAASQNISDNLCFIGQVLWFTTKDSRSIALQSAQKLGYYGGLGFKPNNYVSTEALIGYENNQQLGVQAGGISTYGMVKIKPIPLNEDLFLQGNGYGTYTSIDEKRHSADADFRVSCFNYISPLSNSKLLIDIHSTLLNRDFYSPVLGSFDSLSIERRLEQRIMLNTELGLDIYGPLSASMQLQVESADIDRLYRQPIEGVPTTSVNRNLEELVISLTTSLHVKTLHGIKHQAGLTIYSRDENNSVQKVFDLASIDENVIRKQEFLRDNTTNRIRFFEQSTLPLSAQDTLLFNGSASLLQYNTPSTDNNDDRDEQVLIANLDWIHRISPSLTMSLSTGIQNTHLVFIKSQRSALNNWNRIIRFSPSLHWILNSFEMHPRCEVMANYTVYDFENLIGDTKSFSFRQISYKDSIIYRLSKGYEIETRIFARLFDRGMLSWSEFSETPINTSTEQFVKMLIFVPSVNGIRTGIGVRYYALIQKNVLIDPLGQNALQPNVLTTSIGPEMSIQAQFSNGNTLQFQGWYEWQYSNEKLFRTLPNILLQSSIHF